MATPKLIRASDEIAVTVTPEERARVYRFRYSIYVEEQGKRVSYGCHDTRQLYDEFDSSGVIFYATRDGEITGTVRINLGSDAELQSPLMDWYALPAFSDFPVQQLCFTSRLMVSKAKRSTTTAVNLLKTAYHYVRERGARIDFINCAPELLPFFHKFGCRQYKSSFEDPDVGERIPLVQILDDEEYFALVKSPLYVEATQWPNTRETADWFTARFGSDASV